MTQLTRRELIKAIGAGVVTLSVGRLIPEPEPAPAAALAYDAGRDMFNELVKGIKRQTPMLLDNLGLTIPIIVCDWVPENEVYAISAGSTPAGAKLVMSETTLRAVRAVNVGVGN